MSDDVLKFLSAEMDRATDDFTRLEKISVDIIREAPSGIPLTDGQYQIIQAGRKLRLAYTRYQNAVKRYREYVENGVVPGTEIDPE